MTPLSTFWRRIQRSLFPNLEEELGPLTTRQQRLITALELCRIETFVAAPISGCRGRPSEDRRPIARAFVAKMIYNLPTTSLLIEHLQNDANLRRICGWERRMDVPSEASFSRAFASFATTGLPDKVHAALIENHQSQRLVGHLSRDASAIEAREKPQRKDNKGKATKTKFPRGRPRKDEQRQPKEPTRLERQAAGMTLPEMLVELPTACDVGTKRSSQGYRKSWRGFKLHVDWADGEIPIACVLTSASLHDSQVAIPLAVQSAQRVQSLYDLMDSAYDAPQILAHSQSLGHVPIVDHNPRRGVKRQMDWATAQRYKERSGAERGFSLLKDNYGGSMIRVRGHAKVYAHLMFGILAITAEQLMRLVQ